ncbi:Ribonuclease PH [Buchnera aphidicola (Neophyllaphis podocarpi)]|uniref:ribonuclease PH n=1 Tax=Buchnera aphidicola TaxID=9 RepID=UPI003464830F
MNLLIKRNKNIRPIKFIKNYIKFNKSSVLIESGNTKVICNASIEKKIPKFLKNKKSGWLRAEYSMLPYSTSIRNNREIFKGKQSGRTIEIQRLISRILRMSIDLKKLDNKSTIVVDCDVIQADGGTRTASVNGSSVALYILLKELYTQKKIEKNPFKNLVAGISIGKKNNKLFCDMNYKEDSSTEIDVNIFMNEKKEIIEIQGTSEKKPISKKNFFHILELAEKNIPLILNAQKKILEKI